MSSSLQPHGLHSPWKSPGQITGVHSHSLLWGIFPTQGLNPGLPYYWNILYQLSHQGSPRILEWTAILSPVDLPDPGIEPASPVLQADSLPAELPRKPNKTQIYFPTNSHWSQYWNLDAYKNYRPQRNLQIRIGTYHLSWLFTSSFSPDTSRALNVFLRVWYT